LIKRVRFLINDEDQEQKWDKVGYVSFSSIGSSSGSDVDSDYEVESIINNNLSNNANLINNSYLNYSLFSPKQNCFDRLTMENLQDRINNDFSCISLDLNLFDVFVKCEVNNLSYQLTDMVRNVILDKIKEDRKYRNLFCVLVGFLLVGLDSYLNFNEDDRELKQKLLHLLSSLSLIGLAMAGFFYYQKIEIRKKIQKFIETYSEELREVYQEYIADQVERGEYKSNSPS